jgi:hypothetical protein
MRLSWSRSCWIAVVALAGCGGLGGYEETAGSTAAAPTYGGEAGYADAAAAEPEMSADRARYAQAPSAPPSPASAPTSTTDAVDAAGPLLVYTANLGMSVYRVDEVRTNVIAAVRELGGFMTIETATQVTLRVPAARFREALERIEALGDIVSRHVQAQDVGEEFRDLTIRIETLEAMRRRVERLLEQAQNVQAALEVERHLERITVELETLKGRQRFLASQVALSTVTVTFQERQAEDIARGIFVLPFDWIRRVGLTHLMRLR